MDKYRVMAELETGEEHCFVSEVSKNTAKTWIEKNYDNYPELRGIWIEKIQDYSTWTIEELDEL